MMIQISTSILLSLLFLPSSIFAGPSSSSAGLPNLEASALEPRDSDFQAVIMRKDGKPVEVKLYEDTACSHTPGNHPAYTGAIVTGVKYGIDYSLKEQDGYGITLNGTFNSYKINRDLENNEQIDLSTFPAFGAPVTNPAHPGCSVYLGSAAGNTSVSVQADKCMTFEAACFRIWRA